jgi:hypothetical protein
MSQRTLHLNLNDQSTVAAEQSLAADGAIACLSSNLFPLFSLNADRAPQLKRRVSPLLLKSRVSRLKDEANRDRQFI